MQSITPILGWCLFAQGKFVFCILQCLWDKSGREDTFSEGDRCSVFRLPHLLSDLDMVPIIVTKAWVFLGPVLVPALEFGSRKMKSTYPTTHACFWTIWRSELCEIDLKIWQSRYKCSDMKTGSITIIKVSPPIWMLGLPVTCYWVARRYSRIYRKFKLTTSWCLETCHSDPLGITWPCCCTAALPLMEPGTTSSGIDALGLRLIVLDDEVHTAMPSLFTHVCMSLYTSFCIRGCSNIQSHQM